MVWRWSASRRAGTFAGLIGMNATDNLVAREGTLAQGPLSRIIIFAQQRLVGVSSHCDNGVPDFLRPRTGWYPRCAVCGDLESAAARAPGGGGEGRFGEAASRMPRASDRSRIRYSDRRGRRRVLVPLHRHVDGANGRAINVNRAGDLPEREAPPTPSS
jgi:hypothetical protein